MVAEGLFDVLGEAISSPGSLDRQVFGESAVSRVRPQRFVLVGLLLSSALSILSSSEASASGSDPQAFVVGSGFTQMYDTVTDQYVTGFGAGAARTTPNDVAVSPDGTTVYVASGDSVLVIDAADDSVEDTLQIGEPAVGLALDESTLYVTDGSADSYSIVDLSTDAVSTVALPGAAYGVAASGDDLYMDIAVAPTVPNGQGYDDLSLLSAGSGTPQCSTQLNDSVANSPLVNEDEVLMAPGGSAVLADEITSQTSGLDNLLLAFATNCSQGTLLFSSATTTSLALVGTGYYSEAFTVAGSTVYSVDPAGHSLDYEPASALEGASPGGSGEIALPTSLYGAPLTTPTLNPSVAVDPTSGVAWVTMSTGGGSEGAWAVNLSSQQVSGPYAFNGSGGTGVVIAAPATGTISGVVKDASGNLLSGVSLTITPTSGIGSTSASTGANGAYSISVAPGSYTVSPTGTPTGEPPGGVYTVSSCSGTVSSSACDLTVAGTATASFTYNPPAVTLAFGQSPPSQIQLGSGPGPYTSLGTVQVTVEDANGNVVPSTTAPVQVSLEQFTPGTTEQITPQYSLGGTLTADPVNGVATFSDLQVTGPGTFALEATDTDSSVTGVTSSQFVVTPWQLGFAVPTSSTLGQSFTPMQPFTASGAFTIQVDCLILTSGVLQIVNNLLDPTKDCSTGAITLFIAPNTNGASLSGAGVSGGSVTVNAVNGIAQFQGLTITQAGTYQLVASSAVALNATSPSITVGVSLMVEDQTTGVTFPNPAQFPPSQLPGNYQPGVPPVSVGDSMTYSGSGWDPSGGPVTLTWDLQEGQVSTTASVAPDGSISVPALPMDSLHRTAWTLTTTNGTNQEPPCTANVSATQGSTTVDVLLAGSYTYYVQNAAFNSPFWFLDVQDVGEQVVFVDGDVTAGLDAEGQPLPVTQPDSGVTEYLCAGEVSGTYGVQAGASSFFAGEMTYPRAQQPGAAGSPLSIADTVQSQSLTDGETGVQVGGTVVLPGAYTCVSLSGGRYVTLGEVGSGLAGTEGPVASSCIANSGSPPSNFNPSQVLTPSPQMLSPSVSSPTLNGSAEANGNLTVTGGLTCNNCVLFVNGNLTISGGLSGSGGIYVNGSAVISGATNFTTDQYIAIEATGGTYLYGTGPPAVPQPPAGALSSESATSNSTTGSSQAVNAGTTVQATGKGSFTLAQYATDPVGSPTFSSSGEYFDVDVAPGSSFSSLVVTDCNVDGGSVLKWWEASADSGAGAWEEVTGDPGPTYSTGPPSCVSVTLDDTTSPSLSQLTGTVFAVGSSSPAPGPPPPPSPTPTPPSQSPTITVLISSENPSVTGAEVSYAATVSPIPDAGTVEFTDNGSTITGCSSVPVSTSTGVAACDPTYSSVGSHTIEASYSGDSIFAPSSSSPLTQVVTSSSVVRVYGQDAIATSIAISQAQFPRTGSAGAVVLARSDWFSDALAGGPLAAKLNAPLLVTPGAALSQSLDPLVLAEIERVLPVGGTVYVLGGYQALSSQIDATLEVLGYEVIREAGVDEYSTAVDIAEALGDPSTVFEVSGLSYDDAISAVPAAIASHGAILLTDGDVQAPETAAYLTAHPNDTRYAIGGPLVAAGADPSATAVYGQDLYGTSAAVAAKFFPHATTFGAATSAGFTDGLAAGPSIGREGAPVLLVPPSGPLPVSISQYLSSVASGLLGGTVYGGPLAVADDVLAELNAAL